MGKERGGCIIDETFGNLTEHEIVAAEKEVILHTKSTSAGKSSRTISSLGKRFYYRTQDAERTHGLGRIQCVRFNGERSIHQTFTTFGRAQ